MAKSAFQEQRERHLARMEDALYKQLFAAEGEDGYQEGQYKPYSFTEWLRKAREQNNNQDILGDYNFSPEELAIRKVDNPFVRGSWRDENANQVLRTLGHGALTYGYGESAANNRQFPDEYNRYMNPYEDKVVKQVIEDMRAEKQAGIDDVASAFTKAGAHGSKILKPNAENKYDRAMEKMIMGEAAKLRQSGYQQAAQIFNADRLAREQNIASRMQVPFGMQKFERGQLGTLENLNNANIYDRQAGLNAAHGRFREQHARPFEDISNLHAVFSGNPYRSSENYEQAMPTYPNYFQESKKGGTISFKEFVNQIRNREPHFKGGGFFNKLTSGKNPFKGFTNFKRALPDIIGLGSATFGGVGGGALGGAARAAMLKRNLLEGALKGGMAGYAIPAMAGIAGKAIGNESGLGKFLGDYGASNAGNFGSIGTKYLGMEDSPNIINKTFGINPHGQKIGTSGGNPFAVLEKENTGKGGSSWTDKLFGKDKGYFDYAMALAPVALGGIGMVGARKDAKRERADAIAREEREREMLLRQVAHDEAKEAETLLLNKPVEDERRNYEIEKMKFERDRFKRKNALEEAMLLEKQKREEERREKELQDRHFLAGLKDKRFERPILAFDDGGRVACFKEGGRVTHNSRILRFAGGGYVDGSASGVKDNVRADLPEGAYVLDATTMSLLGDGNSKAGAKKIDDFLNNKKAENRATSDVFIPSAHENRLKKKLREGGELAKIQGRIVPAKISNGEYVLTPEDVLLFSKSGSLEEGAKALDKFREKLKVQKGVKRGGILPVTKSIETYL